MKKIMIAAMQSNSGKTVITCTLLAALKKRGYKLKSYKCGPDYIDPMFHSKVLGVSGSNLDIFLQGEETVRGKLMHCDADICVIEAAMGFYDGIAGTEKMSAWHISEITDTPVILAVNPKGIGITLSAQLKGLIDFRKNRIAGVILNDCSEALASYLREIIERETGLPVLGYLPHMEEAVLQSRHLGLLTAGEIQDISERFAVLAECMEKTADIDRLLLTAKDSASEPSVREAVQSICTIAAAKDDAFCFMYDEDMEELRRNGAAIVPFSPLEDKALPECDGIYLPGGYPELYADRLSENVSMRESVKKAVLSGIPTVAECGGYMYLGESIDGRSMCGVVPGNFTKKKSLVRFGYKTLETDEDTLLIKKGEKIPAHEFHYYDAEVTGHDIKCSKAEGKPFLCGHADENIYAAFPHISFGGENALAERFVKAAVRKKNGS